MEKELNENQIKILEVNTRLSRYKIIENFNKFRHFIDKKGSLDLKNFTEFYQNMLPNKGNAEQFCKFIFYGKGVFSYYHNRSLKIYYFLYEKQLTRTDPEQLVTYLTKFNFKSFVFDYK